MFTSPLIINNNKISNEKYDLINFLRRNGASTYNKIKLFRRKITVYLLKEMIEENLIDKKVNSWGELVYFVA